MRTVQDFHAYRLIDASQGRRLEQWGDILLVRPDPQVIWNSPCEDPRWKQAHAVYHRSQKGGGQWEILRPVPDVWQIRYRDLTFRLKPMGFKHTGLFPEQAVNWNFMREAIEAAGRPVSILNLFAYTGGATLACLAAGASVTHVDASKGMVQWAKENAAASRLQDRSVRWLVDDCLKFVQRERRRGKRYDGVILDPPSYGRGPNGEVWKLEQQLDALLRAIAEILCDDALFVLLNSYTTGLSPAILNYMMRTLVVGNRPGSVATQEIGLPVENLKFCLPCGQSTIYVREA